MQKNKYSTFEDLQVWQESLKLCIEIFNLIKEHKYSCLKDQIQRSSVSIPSNIAEGYERTNKEFIHFLQIAKGSCSELRTQLMIAKETETISIEKANELLVKTRSISGMLQNLINYRRKKI